VLGVLVVYVIVGLTRLLARLPYLGRMLPGKLAYALSVLLISAGFACAAYLVVATSTASSPRAAVPGVAARVDPAAGGPAGRRNRAHLDLAAAGPAGADQRPAGHRSTLASVTSLLVGLVVVFLYATFLLLELRHFPAKLAGLSSDPQRVDACAR